MEWKYLDKEKPNDQCGLYLTYSLNGAFSVAKWGNVWLHTSSGGEYTFYSTIGSNATEDLGLCFYTIRGKYSPLKGVILWCKIPYLPNDIEKESTQIRQYKEQIKKLKEKIKEMERKDER